MTKPPDSGLRFYTPYYLLTYLCFWVFGTGYCLLVGYEQSFLTLNSFRFDVGDAIMPHYTHLGDGVILSCLVAFSLLPREKGGVVSLILVLLLVMVAVSFMKSYLFWNWDRPLIVFEGVQDFYYISLDRLSRRSFPSGHSTAIAAITTFAAYFWEKRSPYLGFFLALLSISVAYSRLYIGVHFLGDILAGTCLGVVLAVIGLRFFLPHVDRIFQNGSEKANRVGSWILYFLIGGIFLFSIYRLIQEYYL